MSLRVAWRPDETPYWSHADTWSNEFTAADGRELDEETEWDEYMRWSKKTQIGTIVGADQEFIHIRLDAPGPGGRTLVWYPHETEHETRYDPKVDYRQKLRDVGVEVTKTERGFRLG